MKIIFVLVAVVCFVHVTSAARYNQCQLARLLLNYGFERHLINDWVCLIYHESRGNTRAINWSNSDGSADFGLFQINSRYWCGYGYRGNGCNMDCNHLLDDNLWDDIQCALKVFRVHHFIGWTAWIRRCNNQWKPDILRQCGL